MKTDLEIPVPILFNPLKHYLPFIRAFINKYLSDEDESSKEELTREMKHIGNCVMDIYTGNLSPDEIFTGIFSFLKSNCLIGRAAYMEWAGQGFNDYRITTLQDTSQWTLKYNKNESRYIHIFPARMSPHTFRIRANTLKSAILYMVYIGKDFVSDENLNAARALAGLSPVKEAADAEAVTEMIEILRSS